MHVWDVKGNQPHRPNLIGLKILIAEDEVVTALDLESMLQRLGCNVVSSAPSIVQALESIQSNPPDAVLLDFYLSDGPAMPVAEALAAARIPFAVLSGCEPGDLDIATDLYLTKPFSQDAVGSVISRLAELTAKASHQELAQRALNLPSCDWRQQDLDAIRKLQRQ